MSATVIDFRSPIRPIAQFIRIGEAHKKLGELHAAGRLPVRRVVIEASRLLHQREFMGALRRDNVEIVLDPQTAELAARAKFSGMARHAPWAVSGDGKPLGPEHFAASAPTDVIGQIARFAVAHHVDAVLAPTHYLADPDFGDWFQIDRASCIALRRALDREGGASIAIDYPVIHAHVSLNDSTVRSGLLGGLNDLPIDNVWVRASGLGHEPKPQSTRQFMASMLGMHNLGKPIIIDHLDGLMGQALLAFGAVSGLSHGISERNQFDARTWHKEPKLRDDDDGFGRTIYVPIPGLGRSVTRNELELLSSARGGKHAVGCQDVCCAHGVQNMMTDHRQHAARQALASVEVLANIPDHNREQFFLDKPLRDAERIARNIKDLRPAQKDAERLRVDMDSLLKRMSDHHGKIVKLGDALNLVHEARGKGAPRAKVCSSRSSSKKNSVEVAR